MAIAAGMSDEMVAQKFLVRMGLQGSREPERFLVPMGLQGPTFISSHIYNNSGNLPVTRTVKVDEKGRILIPKELREKAGIKDSAQVELEEGRIVIKADSLLDNLAKHPIGFTTRELSKLRKMAFDQGLKEMRKDLEKRR